MRLANTLLLLSPVDGLRHYVVCGTGSGCSEGDSALVDDDDRHEVRCCSDESLPGFRAPGGNCPVWHTTKIGGVCYAGKTYDSARTVCTDAGGRLCTKAELEARCAMNTGCGYNRHMIWSSTELEHASGSGDLTHAVESCKCNAVNFACNTDPLEPNSDLHICIKSVSNDVRIEAIELMLAYQGSFAMTIMSNNSPSSSGLTSVRSNSVTTDVPATNGDLTMNGVLVTTKLPFNFFDYADGETVRVTGRLHTKLQESRRRLRSVPDKEEFSSSYEVIVALQKEEEHQEESEDLSSADFVSLRISLLVCVCIGIVIHSL